MNSFCILLQQALNSITGCVVTVLVVTETICAGDNNLLVAQFLSTAVFLAGVATLMQTAVGIRCVHNGNVHNGNAISTQLCNCSFIYIDADD